MAHVAAWKRQTVGELKQMLLENHVAAVVDVRGIPAPQLQTMRQHLRGKARIRMTRNNLMHLAIEEAAKEVPGLEALKEEVDGQCALVSTDINPFKLFREMEATKSPAPAKPGDIAPEDIKVQRGETPFPPGPIVGELQKAGIPAAIEGGKVVIKKEKLLVKRGEPIPEDIAKLLPKLEILPMVVGLDLKAAFENGVLYRKEILDIPPDFYPSMLASAAGQALSLGVAIGYPTRETTPLLVSKAYQRALGLAVGAAIPTRESIKVLLARADSQMLALASKVPELSDERIAGRLAARPAAPRPEKKIEEDEEKEEEVSEEEAAAGLGALFG